MSALEIFANLTPIFLIMAAGATLRSVGWFRIQVRDDALLKILINIFVPCLAFQNVLGNSEMNSLGSLITAPITGLGSILIGIALGWLVMRFYSPTEYKTRRSFAVTVGNI